MADSVSTVGDRAHDLQPALVPADRESIGATPLPPRDSAVMRAGTSGQTDPIVARMYCVAHADGRIDFLVASGPIACIESPEMPHAEPGALLLCDESGQRGRVVAEMIGYGGWLIRPDESVTGDGGRRA